MKKAILLLTLLGFSIFGYTQNVVKCIKKSLVFYSATNLEKCSQSENRHSSDCWRIYDGLEEVKHCLSVYQLKDSKEKDLKGIKKLYLDVDDYYTDLWIKNYQPPYGKVIFYDFPNLYFHFEEAIRYLNLKFSEEKPDFLFLKNRIECFSNNDSVVINAHLSEILNKKVFQDSGIYYIRSIGTYKMFLIHNIDFYQNDIIQEIRMFQPGTDDFNLFKRWPDILWRGGKNELLKSILVEKENAFREAGYTDYWEIFMKRN